MRLLPSGTTALLAELDDLAQVQGLYAAITAVLTLLLERRLIAEALSYLRPQGTPAPAGA